MAPSGMQVAEEPPYRRAATRPFKTAMSLVGKIGFPRLGAPSSASSLGQAAAW